MKVDEFLSMLKGVSSTGDGSWVACCPSHGDEHPSMSVTSKDGKILVHCHVGCSAQQIVEAMGIKMSDLFEEDRRGPVSGTVAQISTPAPQASRKPRMAKRLVCSYTYHDADGNALYRSSRYVYEDGRKTFSLEHWDGSANDGRGGFVFGLRDAGIPHVVYHLPEVIAAARANKSIVIAEGEKDVDNLRAMGFAATCNVGGAGKWLYRMPNDWVTWFKGASRVLVIADNDPLEKEVKGKVQPFAVGQRHALEVARSLKDHGFTGSVKIMVMPTGKDFTDWRDDVHGGRDAFVKVVGECAVEPDEFARRFGLDPRHGESVEEEPSAGLESRFGVLGPRSPETNARCVKVEFKASEKLSIMIDVTCEESVQDGFVKAMATLYRKSQSGNDVSPRMLARLKAWVVASWLLSRGEFFWDINQNDFASCMFIDYCGSENRLMRISSDEFLAFVADVAGLDDVDQTRGDMRAVIGLVKQIAVNPKYSRGVSPSVMWDRRGDSVYISSGDGEMYRLRGGSVDKIKNGEDGVVFLRRRTLEPWKLVDGPGVDPFEKALIFDGANWGDAYGRMNVRLWVLNLFACHKTKPIMLISGLAQSGKTRMAKAVKELLGVRLETGGVDRSVQQIERGDKGQEAFWVTINDGKLEVFDNFDTKVEWASDALQNAATDGQTKRRTLYKTSGVTILKANASLILTSNHPMFLSEGGGGMADRIIDVPLLSKVRGKSLDSELTRDIDVNRDKYLTWIARTVAAALADKEPVTDSVNKRHPDYGEFSIRCARAFGDVERAMDAMGSAEGAKAVLPLKQDRVASAIIECMRARGWVWERFYSGDMSGEIVKMMSGEESEEVLRKKYAPVVVGKVLGKFERQFMTLFKMYVAKASGGRNVYHVSGLTEFGKSQVGKVEINMCVAKSPRDADEYKFTREACLSIRTLHTRARADDSSLREEEEEKEGDSDDLIF